jgi:tRNA-splicing ligase RtcB
MCAAKSNLQDWDTERLKKVMGLIRERIPVGFKHRSSPQASPIFTEAPDYVPVVARELQSARSQIGTLGGGNHFLEIQADESGYLWVMIHSGSRNVGFKIANEYHEKAKAHCERWHSAIPNKELAFLPLDTPDGRDYMAAMEFALKFANMSRHWMLQDMVIALQEVFPDTSVESWDVHHNYARMENHFGKNVLVHRKGATSARAGELGIIPGSQGTCSHIVEGLGNPESFTSCSHGAGRRMGRKQACRELSLEGEVAKLDAAGVIHGIRTTNELDEAPGAYKDISTVMANQADLVRIVHSLRPLAVIKG